MPAHAVIKSFIRPKCLRKFENVRQALLKNLPNPGPAIHYSLLDVGCRDCSLKSYVSDFANYHGLDLAQNGEGTVEFLMDLEQGLPVPDESYDFVTALDVLEHTDHLENALKELVRVTRQRLIIVLPNMAHIYHRTRFFFKGRIDKKYDLLYGGPTDRHRWLTVIPQTDIFMQKFALDQGLQIETFPINNSRKLLLWWVLARSLRLPRSVSVWSSMYVLEKKRP